jgi:hypothetical protein
VGISGKAQTKIIAFNFHIRGSESAQTHGDLSCAAECDRHSPAICTTQSLTSLHLSPTHLNRRTAHDKT